MTRNEKIGLLENYSTFLAANGYMDDDWRSEPPYAIDEFLKLTEDKKAPVSDEAFEMHKLHMLINVLEEFDIQVKWRGEHWTVVMPESHEPFASTIKMNERTKAIQQAIDCF